MLRGREVPVATCAWRLHAFYCSPRLVGERGAWAGHLLTATVLLPVGIPVHARGMVTQPC